MSLRPEYEQEVTSTPALKVSTKSELVEGLGVLDVDIGASRMLVGKLVGKIDLPGNAGWFIWVKVALVGKLLFLGSVELV
jgi:hypothetical protein